MKIVADKDIPFVQRLFSSIGDVTLADARQITPELINDTDILIVRTVTNVNDVLLQGSSLKFVASATSGIDHIDTDTLQDKGIGFAYAPGCNARSVAEYVLSVLFVLAQHYEFKLTEKSVGLIG
ncbi:MAG: erythronate-4-phosphate dehydrogenase, partial [Gammaproteobacteria bacterium]|nr:erythronate-4-phosphate dehydrogenase [Gammaproteobacteria bacterium]